MRISNDVMAVLDGCTLERRAVLLPSTLDRKLYLKVNAVIEALGGKWNSKSRSHVFTHDVADVWDAALSSGEITDVKKKLQAFFTPDLLARKVTQLAEIGKGMDVLEPSAGTGALVAAIRSAHPDVNITAVEIHEPFASELSGRGIADLTIQVDFMEQDFVYGSYDRVVMNPPFSNQQDIDHVLKAFDCLCGGGILVAIMSPGWQFRGNRKSIDFREWLKLNNAEITEVEAGEFKASGTMIRTKLVKVTKRT